MVRIYGNVQIFKKSMVSSKCQLLINIRGPTPERNNTYLYIIVCFLETVPSATGDFMKKIPTATCALRDRYIVSIERVFTTSTFYMKSTVPVPVYCELDC